MKRTHALARLGPVQRESLKMTATRRLQPPSENPSWQPDRFTNHSCTAHCASCAIQPNLCRSAVLSQSGTLQQRTALLLSGVVDSPSSCAVCLCHDPCWRSGKICFGPGPQPPYARMPGPLRTPRRPPPKTTGPLALLRKPDSHRRGPIPISTKGRYDFPHYPA